MDWLVPLSDIDYGAEEEKAVLNVFRSRWLTMGDVTREFECEFAKSLNVKHAIAVSNGTEALHLACIALGIEPDDEVIVPALSFVATANAASYTGAKVRFADIISLKEPCIDPGEINRLINHKTKAVIVMHYAGFPCRMQEILDICNAKGIAVIEDAAHAPGAAFLDRKLGTWGKIGCFSFFSNKNLATGEGGMLVTNDDTLAKRLQSLRSHGMTSSTLDRHQGHAYSYDVVELGYNYRLDEIHSALGLVQLSKLKENNLIRKDLTSKYIAELKSSSLIFPFEEPLGDPSFHIMPTLLNQIYDRNLFMEEMRKRKIQTSIHYPAIHHFSYYLKKNPSISLPITEEYCKRELTLPLFPTMTSNQFQSVINSVTECLKLAVKKV